MCWHTNGFRFEATGTTLCVGKRKRRTSTGILFSFRQAFVSQSRDEGMFWIPQIAATVQQRALQLLPLSPPSISFPFLGQLVPHTWHAAQGCLTCSVIMRVCKNSLKNVHPVLFTHLKALPYKECSFVCHSTERVHCSKCARFYCRCTTLIQKPLLSKSYFLQRYRCCHRTRTLPPAVRFGIKAVCVARADTLRLSFLPPQSSVYMVSIYSRADTG